MRFGSLFAGIGGFDLGLGRCGMEPSWQVERDKYKIKILERNWPNVERWDDVRSCRPETVDLICGGDPCPCRSRARGNRPSKHPDLSGYFLALVARLRPRWVVRENVPAPDNAAFGLSLECLGYRVCNLQVDSRDFTGQSRRRDYLCACSSSPDAAAFKWLVSERSVDRRFSPSRHEEETPIAACLTAHGNRMAAEDTFLYEPGLGLRVLSAEEAEALQGFPRGWTTGFSERRRRAMCGEAVTVPIVEFIGRSIMDTESG